MITPEMRRRIWRIVRIASGSILVALGIVGLVLPVLQGIALILAGLAVLATELPWARRLLHALRDRVRGFRRRRREGGGSAPDRGIVEADPAGDPPPAEVDPVGGRRADDADG